MSSLSTDVLKRENGWGNGKQVKTHLGVCHPAAWFHLKKNEHNLSKIKLIAYSRRVIFLFYITFHSFVVSPGLNPVPSIPVPLQREVRTHRLDSGVSQCGSSSRFGRKLPGVCVNILITVS